MKTKKMCILLAGAVLFSTARLSGQYMDTHFVTGSAGFVWPETQAAAVQANALPKEEVRHFLNLLRGQVPAYLPIHLESFRFVLLEKNRYYLVAATGGERFFWNVDVIGAQGKGFQYSEIINNGGLPLAASVVDLDGDGVDEFLTAEWPAGYQGASTAPIYWYTVWQIRNGVPRNASRHFPDFYRAYVVGRLDYLEGLLSKLQSVDPESTRIPLTEIEYVRLKFQRVVLGQKNTGLDQALSWAQSKDSALVHMGIWSLAEIPAPEADQELTRLTASPAAGDLGKAALVYRSQLLEKQEAE